MPNVLPPDPTDHPDTSGSKPLNATPDPGDGPRRIGPAVKAVAIGLAVDVVGTIITSIVLGVLYGAELAASGLDGKALEDAAMAGGQDMSWMSIGGMIAGTCFSIAGGYVCARIGKRSEYFLATILGILSVSLGLLLGDDAHSADEQAMLALVTFIAILIGAVFGHRRNVRDLRVTL